MSVFLTATHRTHLSTFVTVKDTNESIPLSTIQRSSRVVVEVEGPLDTLGSLNGVQFHFDSLESAGEVSLKLWTGDWCVAERYC